MYNERCLPQQFDTRIVLMLPSEIGVGQQKPQTSKTLGMSCVVVSSNES